MRRGVVGAVGLVAVLALRVGLLLAFLHFVRHWRGPGRC